MNTTLKLELLASLKSCWSTLGVLGIIWLLSGEVLELADNHDLGSCAERRAGSTPAFPIWALSVKWQRLFVVFLPVPAPFTDCFSGNCLVCWFVFKIANLLVKIFT